MQGQGTFLALRGWEKGTPKMGFDLDVAVTYSDVVFRFAKFVLIAALMISIGAQWAALQTAAWVRMAVTYSIQSGSVSEGLSKTFDGEHPCKLCCLVKKAADSEKKDPKQETAKQKIELFAGDHLSIVICCPVAALSFRTVNDVGSARSIAPPTPPPRCVVA